MIYIELTISKKKWCILFAKGCASFNKKYFFEKISSNFSIIANQHENILVAGDFNVDL